MSVKCEPVLNHREKVPGCAQSAVGADLLQLPVISHNVGDVRWGHSKADPGKLRPPLAGIEHRLHIGHCVADVSDPAGNLPGCQLLGQANQAGGIRLVWCIAHGDQWGIT